MDHKRLQDAIIYLVTFVGRLRSTLSELAGRFLLELGFGVGMEPCWATSGSLTLPSRPTSLPLEAGEPTNASTEASSAAEVEPSALTASSRASEAVSRANEACTSVAEPSALTASAPAVSFTNEARSSVGEAAMSVNEELSSTMKELSSTDMYSCVVVSSSSG